jgi:hypothetical protein
MIITPNFKPFGQVEASQLKSLSQGKAKQAHTRHKIMHQLQASIKQSWHKINAPIQSHGKL